MTIWLIRAIDDAQAGANAMERLRASTNVSALTGGATARGMARSAADLQAAHALLGSAWLSPIRLLPYLGRQLDSLDALSGAAGQVATAGQRAARQVQVLQVRPHATPAERLQVVKDLSGVLSQLETSIGHVDLGPSQALLPPLAKKRNTFAHDLSSLRSTLTRAQGAADGLGALLTGSHTYLLLATNNAEMRDGTGSVLEVGTVTISSGALTLDSFTPASDLVMPIPRTPTTGDLSALWGFLEPNQDWRNLDFSPQFPANAQLAASMWRAQTGRPVQGVLDVDIGFLAQILRATGPLTVGGVTVNAANVEDVLMKYQYSGLSVGDPTYDSRQERLGTLAGAVFRAAQSPGVPMSRLSEALATAASGRHLMVWSADPRMEHDWMVSGISGQPAPDGLILGLSNRGGNKLDPYVSMVAHLSIRTTGRASVVTVSAEVTNRDTSTRPSYANGGLYYPPGVYVGYLQLDAPGWADPIQAVTPLPLVAAGPDGTEQAIAGRISLGPGQTMSVTYSFRINAPHSSLTVEPSARIPGVEWDTPSGRFSDDTAHQIRW